MLMDLGFYINLFPKELYITEKPPLVGAVQKTMYALFNAVVVGLYCI